MTIIFHTKRLLFRTWDLSDASAALNIWGDPQVMRFIGAPTMQHVNEVIRSLRRGMQVQAEQGYSIWAVVEKGSRQIVGCAGFHYFDSGPVLEFVVHLARDFWGAGFGTEATRGCVGYAFEELNACKVVAFTHPDNTGAQKMVEKSGFVYVGRKRFGDSLEMKFEITPSAMADWDEADLSFSVDKHDPHIKPAEVWRSHRHFLPAKPDFV